MTEKILFVVESLDLDDSSGSKTSVALIKNLYKAGYEINILHYSQKQIHLEGMTCVLVNEDKTSPNYFLSRLQRILYRWFQWDISKYVDSWFGFSFGFFNDVKSLSQALKKYDPAEFNMIWTLSKGNSYRAHAALLKNPIWHAKWYAYIHDPYPQQLYPRPYNFVPYGFKQKRRFFREVTLRCHRSVFPSLILKQWMQSYYLAVENKSLIIPHQLASVEYSESDLPTYFDPVNFNLLHAGNLLDLRNPKTLVVAFQQFLEHVPEAGEHARLIFIGRKSIFHEYLTNKQSESPQLYISEGYVEFESVYAMQQNASVNIILEAESEISPFLPGKFPHCIAAKRPIILIGPYYSESKRLLGEDYAYQFDFDEINKLTFAIQELYNFWKVNKRPQKLNRADLTYYMSHTFLKVVLSENNSVQ